MKRKIILQRLAYLIFFIFILNSAASKFHLYSSIWFFDMPMHFLGGLWVGLFFIYLFWFKPLSSNLFIEIMMGVLFIGVSWEIFEFIFTNHIGQAPFNTLDTISDICFDLAGGLFTILYVFRSKMTISFLEGK